MSDPDPTRPPPTGELDWPQDRPELLPFLPLVYVAWSDGVLAPEEISIIRQRVRRQEWLDADSRSLIADWLDPASPPSPAALEQLRERVRRLGPGKEDETRRSLVELGVDLARADGLTDAPWGEPSAREALETIEAALGVVGHEAVRELVVPDAGPAPADAPPPSSLDAAALGDFLARPRADVRRRVLDLLEEPELVFPHEIPRDAYRERVLAALRRLADEGLGGLAFPTPVGGADAPGDALAAFETLAFGDLSVLVKYGVHFGLFGGSVHQLGSERHHARWLEDVITLRTPGCFAMTEIGHGSNVREIETEAVYDAETDEIVVHTPHERAGKTWIGNAALHGRVATVFAQLRVGGEDHGVHAIVVPLRDEAGGVLPGIRIADCGPKIGLNGVDNGQIWFDRVRVPRDHLLDRFARITPEGTYESPIPSQGKRFFTMLGTLVAGRISIAAASVSVAKTGLTVAIRHSARRHQFGPSGRPEVPILSYLTQQRLLLPRLAATYGLHFACRELAETYATVVEDGEAGDDARRRMEVEAAGLKAYASRHCVDTLQACREGMGGEGYHAANRLGRLRADTDVFTTFEGANVVLLQLVARGLISEYAEEMGDLKLWDMVRYLAERAGTTVTALNPVTTRRTDEDHLRDPDFHRAAFEYREERLLASVARRLKGLIDGGMDSFDAMNVCQDHLVALAGAHVERRVLEAFRDGAMRAPAPGLSEPLVALATLWALERLEADRGWFLESGYLEAPKAKGVRAQVNALCREVAEHALPLVDAFGIPDGVLRARAGVAPRS